MVNEATTDDNPTEGSPMMTKAKPKAKARKRKPEKVPKAKGKARPRLELTDKGLPVRPRYDLQIGIRVCQEERDELIARGVKDGQHSLSNIIRCGLGFNPLR